MKRFMVFLFACFLCLGLIPAHAETVWGFEREFATNTQVLDLSGIKDINPVELTALMDELPDLNEVQMYDASLNADEVDLLRARYPDVFFGLTFRLKEHIVRTDQTAFSTLHNNRSPTHTSEDFAFLRHCVRLQALDLGHNAIKDLSFLENLTELKFLIIALNQIEDISPLKNLTKLEYLEMFRNKVRDISALSSLENLLDLNLGYNYINDYTPLFALEKMERLWLYKSGGYSKAEMDKQLLKEIRAQLPNCTINSLSAGTSGGWREHPHYDVIFDVFKTSVYKPFADTP